jgi:hypothetical protein
MVAERLTAQLLAGSPARDPVSAVERLLAVQGQDPRGARLAIRSRTTGLSAADVDRALTEDRSLLITWLNRGTLHLIRSEDYPWLQALTTPPLRAGNARRLAQEGVTPDAAERGVAVIVRTEGQALVHLLMLACLRGIAVRGPMIGRRHAYVLVRDWLGKPRAVDREQALAELARRYLVGHGPADDRDLAKWAGLPLRDARAGLNAIAAELDEREDGLVDISGRAAPAELPPPRLLGSFDPVLLGWASREWLLDSHKAVITVNGLFRPFALIDARAVATWSMPAGKVALDPFDRLTRKGAAALRDDALDVVRYLGDI